MAGQKQHMGVCYLCGKETAKGYMGRHILADHIGYDDEQECYLLKIEDESQKYWLYIDISAASTLSRLDRFLREVWLECCGHLSAFMPLHCYGDEYGMNKRISSFQPGTVLEYEYDFGSTTTLYITFVQKLTRKKQRNSVRVLARNKPYEFACEHCGKPATVVSAGEWPPVLYCDECMDKLDDEAFILPVVNSPRMGVCAYSGDFDVYGIPGQEI